MQEIKFIIFYTAMVLFIAYISGLAGVGILQNSELLPSNFVMDYNPLTAFGVFVTLISTNAVPSFSLIFGIVFTPYLVALIYIVWKALPFT